MRRAIAADREREIESLLDDVEERARRAAEMVRFPPGPDDGKLPRAAACVAHAVRRLRHVRFSLFEALAYEAYFDANQPDAAKYFKTYFLENAVLRLPSAVSDLVQAVDLTVGAASPDKRRIKRKLRHSLLRAPTRIELCAEWLCRRGSELRSRTLADAARDLTQSESWNWTVARRNELVHEPPPWGVGTGSHVLTWARRSCKSPPTYLLALAQSAGVRPARGEGWVCLSLDPDRLEYTVGELAEHATKAFHDVLAFYDAVVDEWYGTANGQGAGGDADREL